jgi:murein hydrolase activator
MLALMLAATVDPAMAEARVAALDRTIATTQAHIAAARQPLVNLLAAMQRLALRPGWKAALEPGQAQALAQARMLYTTMAPTVQARIVPLERMLAATQAERDRTAAALEASARVAAERQQARDQAATARLASLPGPVFRPDDVMMMQGTPLYRLPAAGGRVLSGTGEHLETGVQARGLTLATAPGAAVVSPALGWIAYAGRFRGYGGIVIVDHGHGWTTLLAGLDRIGVRGGRLVRPGAALGTMPAGVPRLTIELRHAGRPVDVAAMATAR